MSRFDIDGIRIWRMRMRSGAFHVCSDPKIGAGPFVRSDDPVLLRVMGELGYSSVDEIPVEQDLVDGVCQRCSGSGTEVHHTSPREVFGDDADNWPLIDLCRKCHAEWHERMNAWAGKRRPLGWEGIDPVE